MSSSKGTVLIIEDNAVNAEMAVDLLENAGFSALHASTADNGIDLARAQNPGLILMDVFLPNKSGLEATQILKNDADLKDIPVVAFTALGLDDERKQLMSQGCAGIITKPIDVATFVETVTNYLLKKTSPVKPAAPGTVEEKSTAPAPAESNTTMNNAPHTPQEIRTTISALSHDLQAPARKIHQFCDILLSSSAEDLSPDNRQWVERINKSSQQIFTTLSKYMELLTSV
jgi:two-component system cell cycle response regulator DivK